jgi:hypothetical protein
MTKRRGPTGGTWAAPEMPPLDHVFPAEMGVPQAIAPQVETKEIEQPQVYEETAEELNEVEEIVEEMDQEEPEVVPTPVDADQRVGKKPKTQQENFREVRLAKEKAERERDSLMSAMLEMQSKLQNQQPKQVVVEPEEKDWFDGLDPESLVEGKQLKNIAQEMKAMKKQLREQQQQSQDMILQNKLRTQYPDIDSVVNKETIDLLNEQYPIEAAALGEMTNKYSQAVLAYSTIKNLGLYQQKGQEMKKPAYESDVLRAKVNAAKPRPLASVNPQQGDSPLSKANAFANGLTPDLKAQMLKEMNVARKGH